MNVRGCQVDLVSGLPSFMQEFYLVHVQQEVAQVHILCKSTHGMDQLCARVPQSKSGVHARAADACPQHAHLYHVIGMLPRARFGGTFLSWVETVITSGR